MREPSQTKGRAVGNPGLWLGLAAFGVLLAGELILARQIDRLRNQQPGLAPNPDVTPSESVVVSPPENISRISGSEIGTNSINTGLHLESPEMRIAQLERRLNQLVEARTQPPPGPSVTENDAQGAPKIPEYNVLSPPPVEIPEPTTPIQETRLNDPSKRGWGEEQALGEPDTRAAGDHPSAWASKDPDGGPEWLSVAFEKPVDVAEVRIRESFNPGAISKITGVVNGQEVVLWEGVGQTGPAPRDFVVPVNGPMPSQSIIVHMDTTRVRGWNEIDAIELIGKDGSRQWAASARASSTYAQPRAAQAQNDSSLSR